MEPAKQAKVIREFQKQSTQMDMTVMFLLFNICSEVFLASYIVVLIKRNRTTTNNNNNRDIQEFGHRDAPESYRVMQVLMTMRSAKVC